MGAFSGEMDCIFNAYYEGKLTRACPSAPKRYVNEKSKTVQVTPISSYEDKTRIRFPLGGVGDFDYFIVPSNKLSNLV